MSEKPITRRSALKAAGTVGILGLAGCSGDGSSTDTPEETDTDTGGDGTTTDTDGDGTTTGTAGGGTTTGTVTGTVSDTVNAAFIYQAEVGDVGWDRAHEDARQAVTQEYDWLETDFSEAVATGDVKTVIEQYINDGMDVIFGTTFGYMDPMHEMAPDYPDTVFEHCSGFKTRENMGRYYGRLYQARYLCGVAAGMLTESNQLGYVAAFPIPELVRQINAFMLGARSVNADATMEVRWTNGWVSPSAVTQAVNELTSNGADVINNHQTTTAAVSTANENDAYGFTYTTSMAEAAGEFYGSSALFNWEEFYGPTLKAVRDGSWESDAYWKGLEAGAVGVDDFGPNVSDSVVSEVESTQQALIDGDTTVWAGSKFEGESDSFLFGEMGSYVEGIQGEVPSS
jgi:basic membrane protein A